MWPDEEGAQTSAPEESDRPDFFGPAAPDQSIEAADQQQREKCHLSRHDECGTITIRRRQVVRADFLKRRANDAP